MHCANSTALVSWAAGRGAVQYSVMARGGRSNVSCQTSDLSCSLENLPCGRRYTVQVVAMNDNCSSVPSQPLSLDSGNTCALIHHHSFKTLCCVRQGFFTFKCLLITSSLPASECECRGQLFVEQHDGLLGRRRGRRQLYGVSGCGQRRKQRIVQHHKRRVLHQQRDLWKHVHGRSHLGQRRLPQPAQPGPQHHGGYGTNSFRTHPSLFKSVEDANSNCRVLSPAPCQPQGIGGNLNCVTNSAWIWWDAAPGADSYTVSAAGGWDYRANCTTSSNTTCEVKDLECGKLYNFSVTAKSSRCESWPSAAIHLQTGNRFLTV